MAKKKADNEKKKKKPEIVKTNLDILPIRHYDEKLGCFILDDKSCLDILQIISRDVNNLSDDELRREIYGLIKVFKTVGADIKLMSMNFPLNTSKQREMLRHHLEKASDDVRRKWIQRQIEELETVDENIHTSNFYLLYFGSDEADFLKNREIIDKYVCNGLDALAEHIDKLQKYQIMIKLCNMNGTYDLHYFEEEGIEYE